MLKKKRLTNLGEIYLSVPLSSAVQNAVNSNPLIVFVERGRSAQAWPRAGIRGGCAGGVAASPPPAVALFSSPDVFSLWSGHCVSTEQHFAHLWSWVLSVLVGLLLPFRCP